MMLSSMRNRIYSIINRMYLTVNCRDNIISNLVITCLSYLKKYNNFKPKINYLNVLLKKCINKNKNKD